MWFSFGWLAYEIGKWVGFRVTERALKRLRNFWRGVPKSVDEIVSYDRMVRDEAVGELSGSEKEILLAMNFAMRLNDEKLLEKLESTRHKIESLRESIKFSRPLMIEKGVSAKGLAYLDLVLLSGCFAMSEAIKDELSQLDEHKREETPVFLNDLNKQMRNMDRLVHVRSLAIGVPEKQLLRILETDHPDIYEALRSVAVFAFSVEEEKKGLLRRGQYHKRIGGRALYVAKNLEEKYGPVIGIKDFYLEFRKMNPDVEVSHDDLEKSLKMLGEDGWIRGVEVLEGGNKSVIFKLDHKKVIDLVYENSIIQKQGLTLEELTRRTKWPSDYALQVLDGMEQREIARRVTSPDGTINWYFPGLAKAEKQKESN